MTDWKVPGQPKELIIYRYQCAETWNHAAPQLWLKNTYLQLTYSLSLIAIGSVLQQKL